MAETLTIRTASSTEVVKIAVQGPQGPKGDKGDPGDVAGLPLTTQGDTLYRGASQNQRLPIGTSGQVLKVSAGGVPEWGEAPSGVSSWNDLTDKPASFTPSSHSSTHHTGGTDAIAPNQIGAAWAQVASTQSITGDTLLSAGRNRRIALNSASAQTANIDLPFSDNQQGDLVTLFSTTVGAPHNSTYTIRRAGQMGGSPPAPIAYSTVATINATGQRFTFISDGTATGWSLVPVDTHTHPSSQITGLGTAATQDSTAFAPATGISPTAITGTAVVDNDARLSDSRTPTAHKNSHAVGQSDALAPSDIGAQSIYTQVSVSAVATPTTLTAGRAQRVTLATFVSGATEIVLPTTGNQNSDMIQVIREGAFGLNHEILIKTSAGGSTLATLRYGTTDSFTFRYVVGPNTWLVVPIDSHDTSRIVSGTLDIARIPTGTSSSTVCIGNDARLSDSRTPSSHSASHAAGGSDPLAADQINGQTIFDRASVFYSTDQTLSAQRARVLTINNTNASGITVTFPTEAQGTKVGDTYVIIAGSTLSGPVTLRSLVNLSPAFYETLATLTTSGQQFRFRSQGGSTGDWSLVPVDTHTHAASAITSGTLTHERGGLEADVSAYNGLVKISGGSTSAVGIGTGSTEVAAGDHAHGNLTTDGKIGSTAGLPVVTTTSGAVTTLALGTAGQVLTVNSGANGVEFAAASGGGVTGAASSASDVLGVSGSNITGVDANADRIVFWDDSASALKHLTVGSGLSLTDTTLTATGGGVTSGSVDNAVLRADGTGGSTSQSSDLVIDDAVAPFNITGDAGTDIITAVGHNFTANQGVRFPTLTGGAGLTAATTNYFVRDISGDTFKVSTTSGGSAVNFTTNITAGTVIAMQANVAIRNTSSETNSALVLSPKGTGAFIVGPKPDGTATVGGNPRGSGAICIQTSRTAATQVASGDNSVAIGNQAVASGANDTAVGFNSQATGGWSTAIGFSARSQQLRNVAIGNDARADASVTVSVGGESRATADAATAIGWGTNATAIRAVCAGSSGNTANLRAQFMTWPFAAIYWSGQTTNNTATVLNLDGTATNRFTVPANTAYVVDIHLVARRSDVADKWLIARRFLGIRRNGSNGTALIGTVRTIDTDQSDGSPTWSFSLTADDTNEALQLEVTGATGETVQWAATAFYRFI